jgi:hypothetical protein
MFDLSRGGSPLLALAMLGEFLENCTVAQSISKPPCVFGCRRIEETLDWDY